MSSDRRGCLQLLTAHLSGHQVMINGRAISPPLQSSPLTQRGFRYGRMSAEVRSKRKWLTFIGTFCDPWSPASRVPAVPGGALMAAATTSTSLVPVQPVFTDSTARARRVPGRVPQPDPRGRRRDSPRCVG